MALEVVSDPWASWSMLRFQLPSVGVPKSKIQEFHQRNDSRAAALSAPFIRRRLIATL